MEELVSYDPHLVVGILGGGAGTTYDAFKLLAECKYGARALFGRKINYAEHQLAFVEFLRRSSTARSARRSRAGLSRRSRSRLSRRSRWPTICNSKAA